MDRAFRYQTGEGKDIVSDLRRDGKVEVDVIDQDRISPFLKDIENYGIKEDKSIPWDYEAVNFFDHQDFVCRVYVIDSEAHDKKTSMYIDFYSDYTESSYDDIFLG